MAIPLPLAELQARRVELVGDIQEYIAVLRTLQNLLTPPDVDVLSSQTIDYYIEQAILYKTKIQEAILELIDVLHEIDRYAFKELDVALIQWTEDILLEVDQILSIIALVTIREVDPLTDPETPADVAINTQVNVEIDVNLGDAEEFWDVIGAGLSKVVKAPFALLTEMFEEFTIATMGMMFAIMIDYAGQKLGGFMDNAIGE